MMTRTYRSFIRISIFVYSLVFTFLSCFVIGFDVSSSTTAETLSKVSYFHVDNSMQHSLAYNLLPALDQQDLREEILHVLGLNHQPKPKRHETDLSASMYLIDLYSRLHDDGPILKSFTPTANNSRITNDGFLDDKNLFDFEQSDMIISFVNQIKTQRHNKHLVSNRDRRFWFNITNIPKEANIIDAELRIYRDFSKSKLNSTHELKMTLFELSRGLNQDEIVMNYIDSLVVDGKANGWLRFNVTQSIYNWVKFSNKNLGIYLQIRAHGHRKDLNPKSVGLINSRGFKKYQPFMTVYLKAPNYKNFGSFKANFNKARADRTRRAANKKWSNGQISFNNPDEKNIYLTNSNSNNRFSSDRGCQKRMLYVSFRDLKWQDWIIAPEGYAAYYCHGECSFPMENKWNATNHAIVQHLIHVINRDIPKPCCAPNQLSSIMVLYFDDNSNVVIKKFKNMVVESCGCH